MPDPIDPDGTALGHQRLAIDNIISQETLTGLVYCMIRADPDSPLCNPGLKVGFVVASPA